MIAGGAGGVELAGTSPYANGGAAFGNAGGGGGASALLSGGTEIAVGGGGGGRGYGRKIGTEDIFAVTPETNSAGGGNRGAQRIMEYDGNEVARALGGLPGTETGPGAGGTFTSEGSGAEGLPGIGRAGGNGVPNAYGEFAPLGGSGAGGGGYFGGGSGAQVRFNSPDNTERAVLSASGGGGASYISPDVEGGSRAEVDSAPGQVILIFS